MSVSEAKEIPRAKATKAQSEKLLKKLTSQPCVKKGDESCAPPEGEKEKEKDGRGSLKSVDSEIRMRLASSAEILENMRRDSLAEEAPKSDVIKYSRGDSLSGDIAELQKTESLLNIRPAMSAKFRPGVVNQLIETIIKDILTEKEYNAEEAEEWTKAITDGIHKKTKEQDFARYKFVVSVVLGERRGQGLSAAYRCLWDAEADCAASYTFVNDSLYCIGMVYGVYFY